jgi:hypothetical protein
VSEAPDDDGLGAGHSASTDPRGTVAAGEQPDNWHPTSAAPVRTLADLEPEERDYNRRLYGLTYSERYGRKRARGCVSYCLTPGQRRRGVRCPACYGTVDIRPLDSDDIEPGPGLMERFAAWAGGWAGAFADALLFPFRTGRAHHEAMVRDILREALENGLDVDVLTDILAVLEGIEKRLYE